MSQALTVPSNWILPYPGRLEVFGKLRISAKMSKRSSNQGCKDEHACKKRKAYGSIHIARLPAGHGASEVAAMLSCVCGYFNTSKVRAVDDHEGGVTMSWEGELPDKIEDRMTRACVDEYGEDNVSPSRISASALVNKDKDGGSTGRWLHAEKTICGSDSVTLQMTGQSSQGSSSAHSQNSSALDGDSAVSHRMLVNDTVAFQKSLDTITLHNVPYDSDEAILAVVAPSVDMEKLLTVERNLESKQAIISYSIQQFNEQQRVMMVCNARRRFGEENVVSQECQRIVHRGKPMKDLFRDQYEGANPVITFIEEACKKGGKNNNRSLVIVQSSGVGKTRACLELLKRYYGFYCLCQNIGNGFHSNMQEFKEAFRSSSDKNEICVRFLRTIAKHVRRWSRETPEASPEAWLNMHFRDAVLRSDGLDEVMNEVTRDMRDRRIFEVSNAAVDFIHKYSNSGKAHRHETDFESTISSDADPKHDFPPIVVVFDEAHGLFSESQSARNPDCAYRCLRRALEVLQDKDNIIGVFLSTSSKVNDLYDIEYEVENVSVRADTWIRLPRVPLLTNIPSFDMFHLQGTLLRGRPLWNTQFVNNLDNNILRLIEFAEVKLQCGSDADSTYTRLAMFMLRVSLEPSAVTGHTFVARHMATLLNMHVHDNYSAFEVAYPSEPILVEAATHLMCTTESFSLLNILKAVKKTIADSNPLVQVHKGDAGEVCACVCMLHVLDALRWERLQYSYGLNAVIGIKTGYVKHCDLFMYSHVAASVFLQALVPSAAEGQWTQLLDGYYINCTHFCRWESIRMEQLLVAINRGCGLYAMHNESAVDVVIPMFKRANNGYIHMRSAVPVLVQVKNLASKTMGPTAVKGFFSSIESYRAKLWGDVTSPALNVLFLTGDTKASFTDQRSSRRQSLQVSGMTINCIVHMSQIRGLERDNVTKELKTLSTFVREKNHNQRRCKLGAEVDNTYKELEARAEAVSCLKSACQIVINYPFPS